MALTGKETQSPKPGEEAPALTHAKAQEKAREEMTQARAHCHEDATTHVICIANCTKTLVEAGLPAAQAAEMAYRVWSHCSEQHKH